MNSVLIIKHSKNDNAEKEVDAENQKVSLSKNKEDNSENAENSAKEASAANDDAPKKRRRRRR